MTHPIPDSALDDRLAFVGTAGSGKTYNAIAQEERLLSKGARLIHIDPLGVAWGLRLTTSGKSPSRFPIVIFGGPHGDLPIVEASGALLGETAATMRESCILDLSQLGTKAAERRFMLAFLTSLYRAAEKEPIHLVFDEADMWAPQKLLDKDGDAARLLGQMETIVRRGRVKGFIPWLITQRPAVLSKDVLSQVDGLIALKLTSSQDRNAIGAWVEGQADEGEWKRLHGILPTLQRGHGLIWIPGRGLLKQATFPAKSTFDSSRAPLRGEKRTKAAPLKPLDLTALRTKLASIEESVRENDPTALKSKVRLLQRELDSLRAKSTSPTLSHEEKRTAYENGKRDGALSERLFLTKKFKALIAMGNNLAAQATSLSDALETVARTPVESKAPALAPAKVKVATPSGAPFMNGAAQDRANAGSAPLSRAESRVLTTLAQYPAGRTMNQIAILTGYAKNGGAFLNALSSLRTAGFISGRNTETMSITSSGLNALGSYTPLPEGPALIQHWLGQLGKAERTILQTCVDRFPTPLSPVDLGTATGYEPKGGSFQNALSRLRTLELISGRSEITASPTLMGVAP